VRLARPNGEDPLQGLGAPRPLSEHALEHLLELGAAVAGGLVGSRLFMACLLLGRYLSMLLSIFWSLAQL
jgi:hypothetical protein